MYTPFVQKKRSNTHTALLRRCPPLQPLQAFRFLLVVVAERNVDPVQLQLLPVCCMVSYLQEPLPGSTPHADPLTAAAKSGVLSSVGKLSTHLSMLLPSRLSQLWDEQCSYGTGQHGRALYWCA